MKKDEYINKLCNQYCENPLEGTGINCRFYETCDVIEDLNNFLFTYVEGIKDFYSKKKDDKFKNLCIDCLSLMNNNFCSYYHRELKTINYEQSVEQIKDWITLEVPIRLEECDNKIVDKEFLGKLKQILSESNIECLERCGYIVLSLVQIKEIINEFTKKEQEE